MLPIVGIVHLRHAHQPIFNSFVRLMASKKIAIIRPDIATKQPDLVVRSGAQDSPNEKVIKFITSPDTGQVRSEFNRKYGYRSVRVNTQFFRELDRSLLLYASRAARQSSDLALTTERQPLPLELIYDTGEYKRILFYSTLLYWTAIFNVLTVVFFSVLLWLPDNSLSDNESGTFANNAIKEYKQNLAALNLPYVNEHALVQSTLALLIVIPFLAVRTWSRYAFRIYYNRARDEYTIVRVRLTKGITAETCPGEHIKSAASSAFAQRIERFTHLSTHWFAGRKILTQSQYFLSGECRDVFMKTS
ncbi:hypothetical protein ACOME3_007708 [Neoechinorhynchus agilis]